MLQGGKAWGRVDKSIHSLPPPTSLNPENFWPARVASKQATVSLIASRANDWLARTRYGLKMSFGTGCGITVRSISDIQFYLGKKMDMGEKKKKKKKRCVCVCGVQTLKILIFFGNCFRFFMGGLCVRFEGNEWSKGDTWLTQGGARRQRKDSWSAKTRICSAGRKRRRRRRLGLMDGCTPKWPPVTRGVFPVLLHIVGLVRLFESCAKVVGWLVGIASLCLLAWDGKLTFKK